MKKITTALVSILVAVSASADILVSHIGGNNPSTEGWTASGWRATETLEGTVVTNIVVESGSETTASGTYDYWRILDRGQQTVGDTTGLGGAFNYRRTLTPDDLSDPLGWKLTLVTRVADEGNKALAGYYAGVRDGSKSYALHFWADRVTYWNSSGGQTALFSGIDTTGDYHTYDMVFDPNGDSGAGAVNVFMNGDLKGTITASMAPNYTTLTNVVFGSGGSAASSDQHWNLVTFNTIPEPSLTLLLAGGIALLGVYRIRRMRS